MVHFARPKLTEMKIDHSRVLAEQKQMCDAFATPSKPLLARHIYCPNFSTMFPSDTQYCWFVFEVTGFYATTLDKCSTYIHS